MAKTTAGVKSRSNARKGGGFQSYSRWQKPSRRQQSRKSPTKTKAYSYSKPVTYSKPVVVKKPAAVKKAPVVKKAAPPARPVTKKIAGPVPVARPATKAVVEPVSPVKPVGVKPVGVKPVGVKPVGNVSSSSGPVGFRAAPSTQNAGGALVKRGGPLPPTTIYGRPGAVPTGGRITSRVDPGSPAALGLQGKQNAQMQGAARVSQALQAARMAQAIKRAAAIAQAVRNVQQSQLPGPRYEKHLPERSPRDMNHPTEYNGGGGTNYPGSGGGTGGGGGGGITPVTPTAPTTPTRPTTPTTIPGTPTPPATPAPPSAPRSTNLGGVGTFGRDQRRRLNRGPETSLSLTPEMLRAMAARRFGGT